MCLELQRVPDNYLLTTLESSVSGAPEVNRSSIRLTVIGSSTSRSCQMCCKLPVSLLFFFLFFYCAIFFFSIPFGRSRRSVFWLGGVTLQLSSRQQIKEISLYMIPRGSRLRASRVSGSCTNAVRVLCVVGQGFDLYEMGRRGGGGFNNLCTPSLFPAPLVHYQPDVRRRSWSREQRVFFFSFFVMRL